MMIKKSLVFLLSFLIATAPYGGLAVPRESDRQILESARNLLPNPGAENGKAGWEAPTGSGTFTIESATPLDGKASFVWDPSATGEFIRSKPISIPEGLKGRRCAVEFDYKWLSGVAGEIKLGAFDGSITIIDKDLTPTTTAVPSEFDFVILDCPASGTLQLQLESTANAAAITFDITRIGKPSRQNIVSTAELITSAFYVGTANCVWPQTSTTQAAFSTDVDCPSITVVSSSVAVDTTDDNLPNLVYQDALSPGKYVVTVSARAESSSTINGSMCINDGTDTRGCTGMNNSGALTASFPMMLKATFVYTTTQPAGHTFEVFGATTAATTMNLRVDVTTGRDLNFTVPQIMKLQ